MKKLNLLIVLLIGFTILSCSSDDENNVNQDILIGIWKPTKFVEIYRDAGEVTIEASNCYQQSRLSFLSNSSFNQELIEENNSGDCVEDNNDNFISGTWEKISDNQYDIQITFFNEDTQQNDVFNGDQDEITFPDQNTMIIKFIDGDEFNGDVLEYYYDEYSRVE
jgi:hypothetical protein